LNEATGDTSAHFAELNKLNAIFVKALRDSGGFNADISNPWAIQFHYYSPYQLIFGAWGATAWGSDADKAVLDADFAAFRGNFSNVPIVLGEWEANMFVETSARWKYFGECINFHMK
jgi:endoglucanase